MEYQTTKNQLIHIDVISLSRVLVATRPAPRMATPRHRHVSIVHCIPELLRCRSSILFNVFMPLVSIIEAGSLFHSSKIDFSWESTSIFKRLVPIFRHDLIILYNLFHFTEGQTDIQIDTYTHI